MSDLKQTLAEELIELLSESECEPILNDEETQPVGSHFIVDSRYMDKLCELAGLGSLHSVMEKIDSGKF